MQRVLFLSLLVQAFACGSSRLASRTAVPNAVLESAVQEAEGDPMIRIGEGIPNDWWSLFNDEQLNGFILKAFCRNPTLHAAREQICRAAAVANLARSSLFPDLTLGADVSRQKFSETGLIPFNLMKNVPANTPFPATGGVNGIPVYFTQYETELTLLYDFDLWGKRRSAWKAALGEVCARIADEAFVRLNLGISVANTYFLLQTDYKRAEIASQLVENQEQTLILLKQRMERNLESKQSVLTAESNFRAARNNLLQIEGEIAVKENQLRAYLADLFEEEIYPIEIEKRPLPVIPLPQDLPLHLISSRPDIAAQLWLIESAGNQIKAAKAGFYPDFNLTAIFGYQTLHLKELFQSPSTFYNIDPAVTLPIFDGGRLKANLRASEVNYNLAIYEYDNLVIKAVQEVLDGLAVLKISEKQLDDMSAQLIDQENLLELTRLRVKNHLDSKLNSLIKEADVLSAKDQEIVALGNTIQAALFLIKALGGGYIY